MTKIKVVREKIEVRYNKNQGGQEKNLNKGMTQIKITKKKLKMIYARRYLKIKVTKRNY